MLATVTPAEKGCNKQKSVVESWLGLRSSISREGTMYHGRLIRRLTPISSDPHNRTKNRRKTVVLLERPPRDMLRVNSLENQRETATASTEFTTEKTNIAKAATGDPV